MADHYGAPYCGGLIGGKGVGPSGKGSGPGTGRGQRNQKVLVWPAWRKKGTDVYCSSRWDDDYQIYDLWWTPKSIGEWWETKTYEWVFVQELPFDKRRDDFVWAAANNPSAKILKKQAWWQKVRHFKELNKNNAT